MSQLPLTGAIMGYTLKKSSGGDRVLFSPYSLTGALLPAYLGAAGETKKEMATVLGYSGISDGDLVEMSVGASKAMSKSLSEFNAFLKSKQLILTPEYKIVEGTELIEFSSPDEAVQITNDIAQKKTNGLIKDLLSKDDVDDTLRAILVNTLYFKANWAKKFKADKTADHPFSCLNGSAATVKMMKQTDTIFGYYESSDAQYVKLSYGESAKDISLYIELPKSKTTTPTLAQFTSPNAASFLKSFKDTQIDLLLPKFSTNSKLRLKGTLSDLGMPLAFDQVKSDFSAMTQPVSRDEELYISDVIQQVVFKCDEEGTTAAAATAVVMLARGCVMPPTDPIRVVCDHAFGFLLFHEPTATPLFAGMYNGPK